MNDILDLLSKVRDRVQTQRQSPYEVVSFEFFGDGSGHCRDVSDRELFDWLSIEAFYIQAREFLDSSRPEPGTDPDTGLDHPPFHKCPICEGEIQASMVQETDYTWDGTQWVEQQYEVTGKDVHCENDHYEKEMEAFVNGQL